MGRRSEVLICSDFFDINYIRRQASVSLSSFYCVICRSQLTETPVPSDGLARGCLPLCREKIYSFRYRKRFRPLFQCFYGKSYRYKALNTLFFNN